MRWVRDIDKGVRSQVANARYVERMWQKDAAAEAAGDAA